MTPEAEEAIEQIELIDTLTLEVCEAGEDFAESANKRAQSIGETIEMTGRVTPKQQDALDNIERGIRRWIRND